MRTVAIRKQLAKEALGQSVGKPSVNDQAVTTDSTNSSCSNEVPVHPTLTANPVQTFHAQPSMVTNATPSIQSSIYYHPVYNPLGNPPLGQPQIYHNPLLTGGMVNTPLYPPPPPPSVQRNSFQTPHAQLFQHPPVPIPLLYPPLPTTPRPIIMMGGTNGIPLPPPLPSAKQPNATMGTANVNVR